MTSIVHVQSGPPFASLHSPVSVSVVTITLWVLGRWSPISWVKVLFGDCLVSRALKVQLPLLLLRRLTEWVIKQQQGSTYCEKSQRNSRRDGKWKKHVAHFVGKKIVAGSLLRSSALFCWVEYFIHENHLCEMQLGHIIITPFILFLGVIFCPRAKRLRESLLKVAFPCGNSFFGHRRLYM